MANLWAIIDSRYDHNPGLLANELGMQTPSAVMHWLYGDRRPDIDTAMLLQTLVGLAFECWFQPVPKNFRLPVFHVRMRAAARFLAQKGAEGATRGELTRECEIAAAAVDVLVEALVEDGLATFDGSRLWLVAYPKAEEERLRRERRQEVLKLLAPAA
jgi:hypothetical protein